MPTKTDNQMKSRTAIARMKSDYVAAGWKVVNEEAGAIALSKPAYYVGPASDRGRPSARPPMTFVNWLLGKA